MLVPDGPPGGPDASAVAAAVRQLRDSGIAADKAALDAETMAAVFASGLWRGEAPGAPDPAELLRYWVAQRCSGRPLAHILGWTRAFGHWFEVDEAILAPHPATAIMICLCRDWLAAGAEPALGLEIGFGSGFISLSLAAQFRRLRMIASELSSHHVLLGRRNAGRVLAADRHRFSPVISRDRSEVIEPFQRAGVAEGTIDFVIANPPYLTEDDEISDEYRRHMPREALYAPADDPLYHYRKVAQDGVPLLRRGGGVFVECRASRAEAAASQLAAAGLNVEVLDKAQVARRADLSALPVADRARAFANHAIVFALKE